MPVFALTQNSMVGQETLLLSAIVPKNEKDSIDASRHYAWAPGKWAKN